MSSERVTNTNQNSATHSNNNINPNNNDNQNQNVTKLKSVIFFPSGATSPFSSDKGRDVRRAVRACQYGLIDGDDGCDYNIDRNRNGNYSRDGLIEVKCSSDSSSSGSGSHIDSAAVGGNYSGNDSQSSGNQNIIHEVKKKNNSISHTTGISTQDPKLICSVYNFTSAGHNIPLQIPRELGRRIHSYIYKE